MVRKNKGKKKKGGGGRTTAPKVKKNDSDLVRVRNVWPELDEIGRWTCTNCRSLNSMITGQEPGGCYDCGHSELDEKFAVLIIPILVQLHNAGWVHRINLRIRSTWKPSVVLDAHNTFFETINNNDVSIDQTKTHILFERLHRLIKIRSLIYEEDSGPEEVLQAVEMIVQSQNYKYMTEIVKTTEFHTLVDCIQHYHDQKSKAASSISSKNNNNDDSRITDDKKMDSSNMEENTDQQSINKSPLTQTDIDTRLMNQYITPLLNELKKDVTSWTSTESYVIPKEAGLVLVMDKLESNDITSNPRSVIQAQLKYVQLTNDHLLDNRFSTLRDLANARSTLKSDGIEMAAAKLEEASHKQHMRVISQEPLFQSLLSDMKRLASVNNSNKSDADSLKPNTNEMETVEPLSVGFNQSWHSDDDTHHRREMIQNM